MIRGIVLILVVIHMKLHIDFSVRRDDAFIDEICAMISKIIPIFAKDFALFSLIGIWGNFMIVMNCLERTINIAMPKLQFGI